VFVIVEGFYSIQFIFGADPFVNAPDGIGIGFIRILKFQPAPVLRKTVPESFLRMKSGIFR
jgi:hypothetical protein